MRYCALLDCESLIHVDFPFFLSLFFKIQTQKGSNERLFILFENASSHSVSGLCFSCVAPSISFEWNQEVLDLTRQQLNSVKWRMYLTDFCCGVFNTSIGWKNVTDFTTRHCHANILLNGQGIKHTKTKTGLGLFQFLPFNCCYRLSRGLTPKIRKYFVL